MVEGKYFQLGKREFNLGNYEVDSNTSIYEVVDRYIYKSRLTFQNKYDNDNWL